MPLCGLIGSRILCMHGGLSPHLQSLDQLRQLPRPQDPPNPSIGIDLLWADPDQWVKGWQANTRGVSYVFGQDVVADLCSRLDIDLVARAHQVVQDGYEFFASKKMVTIFSAPHYCGQFDNSAATMKVCMSVRWSAFACSCRLTRTWSARLSCTSRLRRLCVRRRLHREDDDDDDVHRQWLLHGFDLIFD